MPLGSESAEFILVDRQDSPFGAGWWVAGLEQLFFQANNRILWLGGDGSARVFEPAGTDRWVAPSPDRVEVLTKQTVSGSVIYARELSGGTRVEFNATGRHVAPRTACTIGRLNRPGFAGDSRS